jgi:hypothetical protein
VDVEELEMPFRLFAAAYMAACVVLIAGPAAAYVDPGTGSMLVQMLVAGVAAGFTTIGLYWSRLKAWLRGERPSGPQEPD